MTRSVRDSEPTLTSACWRLFALSALSSVLAVPAGTAIAQGEDGRFRADDVLIFQVNGEIDSSQVDRMERSIDHFVEIGIRHIVIELDTDGGGLDAGLEGAAYLFSLRKRGVMTYAYVPNGRRAYSAGTLLAFGCSAIAMGDDSAIGDVAPVLLTLTGPQELGEKIQSPVRAKMEYYARANNYPVALAKAMVSKDIQVYALRGKSLNGERFVTRAELQTAEQQRGKQQAWSDLRPELVVEEGKILTIDERKAFEYEISDLTADSANRVALNYVPTGRAVYAESVDATLRPPLSDAAWVRFLNYPLVKFLLLVIGVVGVVLEFKLLGTVVPGAIGLGAFALFFTGGYMGNMVGWPEVVLFLLAGAFIAVEIFVVPGFGVMGFLGLAFLFTSLVLGLQVEGEPLASGALFDDLLFVVGSLAAAIGGILVLLRFLPDSGGWLAGGVVSSGTLGEATSAREDPRRSDTWDRLIGRRGTVESALRPAGKIVIEDAIYDVVAEGGFVPAGTEVEVALVEGNRIVVRPVSE